VKRIPLKTLPDPQAPNDVDRAVVYDSALREVIRQPLDRQKGADITEIRQSIRIMDALDKANGTLELEDADWQFLKSKIDAMPWAIIDRRILELVDDVTGAS
jgi:hypothetical protein